LILLIKLKRFSFRVRWIFDQIRLLTIIFYGRKQIPVQVIATKEGFRILLGCKNWGINQGKGLLDIQQSVTITLFAGLLPIMDQITDS